MKRSLSIGLAALVVISAFSFSACSQLDIAQQPDPIVIYANKVYPDAIGNYLTDTSVQVPAIDAYMQEYNKNADETAVINYETIKYNKTSDYYYVNDAKTDVGIKFRLNQSMEIVSASIYAGSLDQTTKNVYNVVINAIETSGYKALMTDADRAIIQHTLNGFNNLSSSKNDVQQIFNGQENFAAKWENNMAEFEIPVKPSELPKPDNSHKLPEIQMPTIEVPSITLDTTIVEGTHLDDGTPVKKEDITDITNKITDASSHIESVKAYNKTDVEGVNKILDNMVLKSTMAQTGKLLTSAGSSISTLQNSSTTAKMPTTKELTKELMKSYEEFEKMTKVTYTLPSMSNETAELLVSSVLLPSQNKPVTKPSEQAPLKPSNSNALSNAKGSLNVVVNAQENISQNVAGKKTTGGNVIVPSQNGLNNSQTFTFNGTNATINAPRASQAVGFATTNRIGGAR